MIVLHKRCISMENFSKNYDLLITFSYCIPVRSTYYRGGSWIAGLDKWNIIHNCYKCIIFISFTSLSDSADSAFEYSVHQNNTQRLKPDKGKAVHQHKEESFLGGAGACVHKIVNGVMCLA